jgi:hypothetical protein
MKEHKMMDNIQYTAMFIVTYRDHRQVDFVQIFKSVSFNAYTSPNITRKDEMVKACGTYTGKAEYNRGFAEKT